MWVTVSVQGPVARTTPMASGVDTFSRYSPEAGAARLIHGRLRPTVVSVTCPVHDEQSSRSTVGIESLTFQGTWSGPDPVTTNGLAGVTVPGCPTGTPGIGASVVDVGVGDRRGDKVGRGTGVLRRLVGRGSGSPRRPERNREPVTSSAIAAITDSTAIRATAPEENFRTS